MDIHTHNVRRQARPDPIRALFAAVATVAAAVFAAVLLATPAVAAGRRATAGHRGHAHTAGHRRKAHGRTARAGRARKGKAKKGKKKAGNSERKVEASIFVKFSPPSEQLPQTGTINLYVPKRFRDAGAKLPHCTADQLIGKGPRGCPKNTVVGNGVSIGYTILGGQFVKEHLTLTIFNGPKASLLTWVEGRTPVAIEEIVNGVITKPSGFGQELSFTIPQGLLEPLPGAPGWLATLNAHLSGKVGWLRSTSCPPHPWALKAEFGYTNLHGSEALGGVEVESKISCV